MQNENALRAAERDYLLALHLFPNNRHLYRNLLGLAVPRGERLFEPHEIGHPASLRDWIDQVFHPPAHAVAPPAATWTISTLE